MGESQRTLASVQLSIDDTSTESPAARLVWATWLNQPNRRGTDPYARWCGRGVAVRLPPVPISAIEPVIAVLVERLDLVLLFSLLH